MSNDHNAIVYAVALAVFVLAVIVDVAKPKWKLTVAGITAIGLALLTLVPLCATLNAT